MAEAETMRSASIGCRLGSTIAAAMACCALFFAGAAPAMASPVWDVKAEWGPTNPQPEGEVLFMIQPKNIGDTPSSGTTTIVDELPPGYTWLRHKAADTAYAPLFIGTDGKPWSCSHVLVAGVDTVTCTTTQTVANLNPGPGGGAAGMLPELYLRAKAPASASEPGINTVTVSNGGAATPSTTAQEIPIPSPSSAGFGLLAGSFSAGVFDSAYPADVPAHQAGSHPYEMRVDFDVNEKAVTPPNPRLDLPGLVSDPLRISPEGNLKTVAVTLPRGLIGNPEAVPKCTNADFLASGKAYLVGTNCPSNTQVGYIELLLDVEGEPLFSEEFSRIPIYNLEPPDGTPVDLGFNVGSFYHGHIFASLDPAHNYAIESTTAYISALAGVRGVRATLWGVPGDPAHNLFRSCPEEGSCPSYGASLSDASYRPFLTLPMDCGTPNGELVWSGESWQHQGAFTSPVGSGSAEVDGCDDPRIRFNPEIALQPTSRDAGGPTGLAVHLEVPQRDDAAGNPTDLYAQNGNVRAIPTPPLKKAVVTLPEGMTISTSAAQGLGSCTAAQIGLGTNSPVECPDNSQYGTVTIHTPILPSDEPMKGFIYIAKQDENPFGSFLALYLVIQDPSRGLLVKVPGRVELDEKTGQIKTTFDDLPQFPVSDIELNLKSGVRAGLVNPATCGTKKIEATFYSWSDPNTPVTQTSSYDVTQKADGSACVKSLEERPFNPQMSAGTVNPSAGAYSPFVFRLTRSDDDQEFSQLQTTLPPGLIAKIAGLTQCSDAAIKAAEAPGRAGRIEQLFPSCPASSQIGTTDVGSGVGQAITYIPGKVYLAGPYKGAPLSMVVITPVVAGPYDLGTIAVRAGIHLDPKTAEVSVQTDPFPQIYKGIPVRLRDVRVKVNRPETILNPTSCAPMAIGAHVTGTGGDLDSTADDRAANLAERFQAANCASLGFKPRISIALAGGTKRGAHPALRAELRARPGDANIADTTVTLPRSAFLDQAHIRTICTRVQFAAHTCPAGSIYGHAKAFTPLLDTPLEGPVYLRSSSHNLPDLVATLNGQIDVEVSSRIDSLRGRIRSTFAGIPDAPVSRFLLSMQGGKKGLIQNSINLCSAVSRARIQMTGHNGKPNDFNPAVKAECKKAKRKHKQGGKSR